MPRTTVLTKVPVVVFLVAMALPSPAPAHAQQPQAGRPTTTSQDDLSGRWRFSTFGSIWIVDLKLEPSKNADSERLYCGEAARERRVADTPISKARLCAQVDPDEGQLEVEVSGASCKAPMRSTGTIYGTCAMSSGMGMTMKMGKDDDGPPGPMETPMGGFTAIRVAAGAPK